MIIEITYNFHYFFLKKYFGLKSKWTKMYIYIFNHYYN